MTGREYLRSLSDEELAKVLYNRCKICIHLNEAGFCQAGTGQKTCETGRLAWLRQEYKGDIKIK